MIITLVNALALLVSTTIITSTSTVYAQIPIGSSFTDAYISYYGDGGADPPPIKPNYGACGFDSPKDPHYFAALYQPTFNKYMTKYPSSVCGQCIEISCASDSPSQCIKGVSTIVEIVDSCPGCKATSTSASLDVSKIAFGDLVGGTANAVVLGVMKVQWKVVQCPSVFGKTSSSGYNTPDVVVPAVTSAAPVVQAPVPVTTTSATPTPTSVENLVVSTTSSTTDSTSVSIPPFKGSYPPTAASETTIPFPPTSTIYTHDKVTTTMDVTSSSDATPTNTDTADNKDLSKGKNIVGYNSTTTVGSENLFNPLGSASRSAGGVIVAAFVGLVVSALVLAV
ncbi:hypothetical protein HDU76_009018 [Blyttiomyces sp. JEL0837]|nr:hypothetical protein HDU76_009018 [Blyttiomyces sp. JEL0837]